jgi:hypothetical protein
MVEKRVRQYRDDDDFHRYIDDGRNVQDMVEEMDLFLVSLHP